MFQKVTAHFLKQILERGLRGGLTNLLGLCQGGGVWPIRKIYFSQSEAAGCCFWPIWSKKRDSFYTGFFLLIF